MTMTREEWEAIGRRMGWQLPPEPPRKPATLSFVSADDVTRPDPAGKPQRRSRAQELAAAHEAIRKHAPSDNI